MGTHYKHLGEVFLTSALYICFHREMKKNIYISVLVEKLTLPGAKYLVHTPFYTIFVLKFHGVFKRLLNVCQTL